MSDKPREWQIDCWDSRRQAICGEDTNGWVHVIEYSAYQDLIKALRDIAKAPCASSDHSEYNCASCLAHSKLRSPGEE